MYESIQSSLNNANELIGSHPNLELYAAFYKYLSGKGVSGKHVKRDHSSKENLYFFE